METVGISHNSDGNYPDDALKEVVLDVIFMPRPFFQYGRRLALPLMKDYTRTLKLRVGSRI